MKSHRTLAAALGAVLLASCAGGGQNAAMMPLGGGTGGAAGSTIVRIYVPAGGQTAPQPGRLPTPAPVTPLVYGAAGGTPTPAPPAPASPAAAGPQVLAINVSGPVTISQTVSVGPGASGCAPSLGGTTCQLSLNLPAGTYAGTIGAYAQGAFSAGAPAGSAAVAFTVLPSASNTLNLTVGGVPAQLAIVPATFMSAANPQGAIDLYGAGRHPLAVELLDANQNVIVGGGAVGYALTQTGGALPLGISQGTAPNLFYVSPGASGAGLSGLLRATATAPGGANPCVQTTACSGTARVEVRQVLGVANASANDVTLYAGGWNAPLTTIVNGIGAPQALAFDSAGDLFVANELGSVNVYAPPYAQAPTAISQGINHPQALALDARGDLFVANGNGSNTVTLYSQPYGGAPAATISAGVNDPVALALDPAGDLFVVNAAANSVTVYAPPYTGEPATISKGLSAPNSLALDAHGNLFVANVNATPNSVVEYSPPYSEQSAPVATITSGISEQGTIGLNAAANLFVPNQGANTVTEYVAPYTGEPVTIVGGQSQPVALAIDAGGNLYVANYGNSTVTQYAPPYAGGTWTTISNGIASPQALALSPATSAGPALLP